MGDKKTSKKEASVASQVLRNPASSKISKQLAGSALAQFRTKKHIGVKEAAIASQVLRDPAASQIEKSMAGSVFAQAEHKK